MWEAYRRVWDDYIKWYSQVSGGGPSLPYHIVDIMYFVAYLRSKDLAPTTIQSQLSAIAFLHKINNLPDLTAVPVVQKLMQGVHKQQPTMDARLPITRHILHQLCRKARTELHNQYDAFFIQALALVAFHGFFRLGELIHKSGQNVVHMSHLTFTRTGLQVTIPKSKASSKPEVILVPALVGDFCPVAATKLFLQVRGTIPGPLFAHVDGSGYTYSHVNRLLATLFAACGLDSRRYKGHSFRIGAASEAAKAGFSDAQIRLMGRWRSDAFRKYIRLPF